MSQRKITWKDFEEHCRAVEQATTVKPHEPVGDKLARIARGKKDYAYFFEYYFPHYAKAKTSKHIVAWANAELKKQDFKGIIEAFRGFSKSTHGNLGIPLWLMVHGELKFQLTTSATEAKAKMLIGSIQAELMRNQRFINDFGYQFQHGNWSDGHFVTKDNVAFAALGIGQSPQGIRNMENRPDRITVDDADTDEMCRNPRRLRQSIEWIEDSLMGCFDIGRQRFALINSRISKMSILALMVESKVTNAAKKDKWYYLLVNAVDQHGRSTYPEKYPDEYWTNMRATISLRAWQKNYMNNPIEEGTVFKLDWIKWKPALPLNKYDRLIAYCDPSFKSTVHSDFKAIKVWGKYGTELHLLKAFVRQTSISTMVKWFYELHESMNGVLCDYYMEANFLQDLMLDEFTMEGSKRGYQLPIRKDMRSKPDKFSRIESMSPLYERGFIFYNEKEKSDPDMQRAVEQLLAVEQGSKTPDDSPDADEGAIFMLQKFTRAAQFAPRTGRRQHINSY